MSDFTYQGLRRELQARMHVQADDESTVILGADVSDTSNLIHIKGDVDLHANIMRQRGSGQSVVRIHAVAKEDVSIKSQLRFISLTLAQAEAAGFV